MGPEKRIKLAICLVLFFSELVTERSATPNRWQTDGKKRWKTKFPGSGKMKLCLFTADEQECLRKKAISVGVEKVVVKSPEAGAIVEMVSQYLSFRISFHVTCRDNIPSVLLISLASVFYFDFFHFKLCKPEY